MTITLQAVNELIKSLESAGELSIKETKVMALAKAYQQLAAENVGLNKFIKQSCYVYNGDGSDVSDSYIPAHESPMMPVQAHSLLPVAAECLAIRDAFIRYLASENMANKPDANEQQVYDHCAKWVDAMCETPAIDAYLAEIKSHDLNAFISHYSAELDEHIANGGDQFDATSIRLRGFIVGGRMFREKLRDEDKALALREGADK
ncbi:hypothetical protein ABK857_04215 [Klebsiella michiganensis]